MDGRNPLGGLKSGANAPAQGAPAFEDWHAGPHGIEQQRHGLGGIPLSAAQALSASAATARCRGDSGTVAACPRMFARPVSVLVQPKALRHRRKQMHHGLCHVHFPGHVSVVFGMVLSRVGAFTGNVGVLSSTPQDLKHARPRRRAAMLPSLRRARRYISSPAPSVTVHAASSSTAPSRGVRTYTRHFAMSVTPSAKGGTAAFHDRAGANERSGSDGASCMLNRGIVLNVALQDSKAARFLRVGGVRQEQQHRHCTGGSRNGSESMAAVPFLSFRPYMPTLAVLRVRAHSFSPQNVKADVASNCLASGMPAERPVTVLKPDMKRFRDRLIAGWMSGNGGSRVCFGCRGPRTTIASAVPGRSGLGPEGRGTLRRPGAWHPPAEYAGRPRECPAGRRRQGRRGTGTLNLCRT